jgi:hypothetical protein
MLLYATLRYSTLRYSTLLYATLRYSTLLYATLRYSTLLYATLRCSIAYFLSHANLRGRVPGKTFIQGGGEFRHEGRAKPSPRHGLILDPKMTHGYYCILAASNSRWNTTERSGGISSKKRKNFHKFCKKTVH